jgi:hypothetical protein
MVIILVYPLQWVVLEDETITREGPLKIVKLQSWGASLETL